jgi:hypothetical protein
LAEKRGHYFLKRITIFRKGTFFDTMDSNFEICNHDETAFPTGYIRGKLDPHSMPGTVKIGISSSAEAAAEAMAARTSCSVRAGI